MDNSFTVSGAIIIASTQDAVWDMLTNPQKIKLYLGVDTVTDWKPGSAVSWQGEMAGQKFEDKGKVIEYRYPERLKFSFWSHWGGYPDTPENYSVITYTIEKLNENQVRFTYAREAIPAETEYKMFNEHLRAMLESIKERVENGNP